MTCVAALEVNRSAARRRTTPVVVAVVTGLAVMAVGGPMRARAGQDPLAQLAYELYASGKYEEAIERFARLFAAKGEPQYMHSIGRCNQNLGRLELAIINFRDYLRRKTNLAPEERKRTEEDIQALEQQMAQRSGAARCLDSMGPAGPGPEAVAPLAQASPSASPSEREIPARPGRPAFASVGPTALVPLAPASVADRLTPFLSSSQIRRRQEAMAPDEQQIARIERMLAGARAKDPRLAEYRLRLARLYGGKHFYLRQRANEARKNSGSGEPAGGTADDRDARALDQASSDSFVKAVTAYIDAARDGSFARRDEVLFRLAIILQANDMEPRARDALTRLLTSYPQSKYTQEVLAPGPSPPPPSP